MEPTQAQRDKIKDLLAEGYKWDKEKSVASAGVVLTKDDSLWFFGLAGEIMENPDVLVINTGKSG